MVATRKEVNRSCIASYVVHMHKPVEMCQLPHKRSQIYQIIYMHTISLYTFRLQELDTFDMKPCAHMRVSVPRKCFKNYQ